VGLLGTLAAGAAVPLAGCTGPVRAPAPSGTARGTAAAGPTAASPALPGASPGTGLAPADLAAAQALLRRQPGTMGVVVRDRRTGTLWRAGTTDHLTWTASTIKLALVTAVLEGARAGGLAVDAAARRAIADILDHSDDAAATALWQRYGRDTLVPVFQRRYGMAGLTFPPGFPRAWGHLKCTAEDLADLMSYVLDRLDPTDRAYLVDRMRQVGPIQRWGVWSAGPALRPGTKDGWSIEPDPGGRHWVTNAVGFAGPDERYVVAVMYQLPAGPGIDVGVHAVSDLVATLFGAAVPAPVTVPDPSTGL